jgi:hypothetical protein
MPDAELTVKVLRSALSAGRERQLWSTLRELDAAAGLAPRPAAPPPGQEHEQAALF